MQSALARALAKTDNQLLRLSLYHHIVINPEAARPRGFDLSYLQQTSGGHGALLPRLLYRLPVQRPCFG